MRKVNVMLAAIVIIAASTLYACSSASSEEKKEPIMSQAEMVKRGDYLVNSVGCDDCHSPKRFGPKGPEVIPELRLSGYPSTLPIKKPDSNVIKQGWMMFAPDLTSAVGPWGISFAANITPDETGIGNWTEQNFMTAIRHGKSKGLENNRDLLPPMPWFVYKNFTDEDIKSIFAYLKSLPPVHNIVPAPKQIADIK